MRAAALANERDKLANASRMTSKDVQLNASGGVTVLDSASPAPRRIAEAVAAFRKQREQQLSTTEKVVAVSEKAGVQADENEMTDLAELELIKPNAVKLNSAKKFLEVSEMAWVQQNENRKLDCSQPELVQARSLQPNSAKKLVEVWERAGVEKKENEKTDCGQPEFVEPTSASRQNIPDLFSSGDQSAVFERHKAEPIHVNYASANQRNDFPHTDEDPSVTSSFWISASQNKMRAAQAAPGTATMLSPPRRSVQPLSFGDSPSHLAPTREKALLRRYPAQPAQAPMAQQRIRNLLLHPAVFIEACDDMFQSADANCRKRLNWRQTRELGDRFCSRLGMPGVVESRFSAVFQACDEDGDGLIAQEELSRLLEVYLRMSSGLMDVPGAAEPQSAEALKVQVSLSKLPSSSMLDEVSTQAPTTDRSLRLPTTDQSLLSMSDSPVVQPRGLGESRLTSTSGEPSEVFLAPEHIYVPGLITLALLTVV